MPAASAHESPPPLSSPHARPSPSCWCFPSKCLVASVDFAARARDPRLCAASPVHERARKKWWSELCCWENPDFNFFGTDLNFTDGGSCDLLRRLLVDKVCFLLCGECSEIGRKPTILSKKMEEKSKRKKKEFTNTTHLFSAFLIAASCCFFAFSSALSCFFFSCLSSSTHSASSFSLATFAFSCSFFSSLRALADSALGFVFPLPMMASVCVCVCKCAVCCALCALRIDYVGKKKPLDGRTATVFNTVW